MIGPLRALWSHPLGKRRPLAALLRFVRWQCFAPASPEPQPWIGGARILAARHMAGATGNLYFGLHELPDMAFMLHYLRPDDWFGDIGANIGSYSVLAGGLAKANVLACEPDPTTAAILLQNLELNSVRGRRHQVAVGDRVGEAVFSMGLDTKNHILGSAEGSTRSQRVPMTTLDELFAERAPRMLKIDVEGGELLVLAGAKNVLAGSEPMAIEIEVEHSDRGVLVHGALSEYGFVEAYYDPWQRKLQQVRDESLHPHNQLFIRGWDFAQHRLSTAAAVDVFGTMI